MSDHDEAVRVLRKLVTCLIELIDESEGVTGLHKNGDIATWEELTDGGRGSAWMGAFYEAIDLLEEEEAQ